MKKFIVLALSLLCLSGCTKALSEETPTTTTPSIETTPSTTTAIEPIKLVDENGYEYEVVGNERKYQLFGGHIEVYVPELSENTKLYIYNESTSDIEDSIVFQLVFQPEGCEKEQEGCYWELTQSRFFEGDMVQPNDENGYPMYPNDDEHKGYQAYDSVDPNDKFSVLKVPQFSNEEYMEAYNQSKAYIKPVFVK